MKKIISLVLFVVSILANAQIKGKVTSVNNNPLPYVSIYLEHALTGTTTNDNGQYELNVRKRGEHVIIFQFLGFKTVKKRVYIDRFPYLLNIQLTEKQELLDEVDISSKENPAYKIIRRVIANKEKNTDKSGKYTADFYSRGLFKIKDAPERILGQKLGDLGGGLDSTRSGILYLSETVSKITYQKHPKKFKEVIIASKVSGSDNGISFNRADDVNFNLYKNQVPIADSNLFSPISDYAFTYYGFALEGTFYNNNGQLISKIKLIPQRKNDPVFGGHLYIVEDDWAIYGAELTVTGAQINNPAIDLLHIKQNYNYDSASEVWALILQTIDFKIGFLGFNMNGRFSASYSNYNFDPIYTDKTFTKEILVFEKNATKKDSAYWSTLRSVPLTSEERRDYSIKDSLKLVHSSKPYLDSIDQKNNKLKLTSPILGYTYRNSSKNWKMDYNGLIEKLGFNTIQGFNATLGLKYTKEVNKHGKYWTTGIRLNYGLSDKRARPVFSFYKKWNNFEKPRLTISSGTTINQFDNRNPISNFYNSLYSLFDKKNYAKFYEKTFAKIDFSQDIVNGVRFFSSLEYANRNSLFNTTDYSFFNKDATYQTNNPITNTNLTAAFNPHHIVSAKVSARIYFNSKYISYPDSKYTVKNNNYPVLHVGYRKNFGASDGSFNSDFIFSRLEQDITLGQWGNFAYNARGGLFIKQNNIPFMDYYHPIGNEIDFAPKERMSRFNILPYYQLSTNDRYAELHTEHNFKGFLLHNIPLVNRLNLHTVIGVKTYISGGRTPYTEYAIGLDNIGWGKWRFLRIDYVQSKFNGTKQNGLVFGLRLF